MALTKKITGAIAAIVLVLMVTVVTFAFKAEPTISSIEKTVDGPGNYYFNGSDYTDDASWGLTQDSEFSCGANSELPCKITVPEGYTLQEYLDEHATNILAVSDGERIAAP